MTSSNSPSVLPELVYLFAVEEQARQELRALLYMTEAPSHVRVATLAPLSNFGFRPDVTAQVLSVSDRGFVFGAGEHDDIPRAFVPWTNVAYVADGSALGRRQEEVREARVGARGFIRAP